MKKIHCEFLRKILHLRKSTPLYILYAEAGRYPLELTIKCRMIGFWNRLITWKQSKLSYRLYQCMKSIPDYDSKWINKIQNILTETVNNIYWLNQDNIQDNSLKYQVNQDNIQDNSLKYKVKRVLLDQNLQNWRSSLNNSSKGRNYSILKETIKLEIICLN